MQEIAQIFRRFCLACLLLVAGNSGDRLFIPVDTGEAPEHFVLQRLPAIEILLRRIGDGDERVPTDDPFDPDSWWQHGRQVKQVMGEYGGMAYYIWKQPWQ